MESLPAIEFEFFDLIKDAKDWEITNELPPEHVFDKDEFWPHLKGMIEWQWGGKEGPLLSNGFANIFYVRDRTSEVFKVFADWCADDRRWNVNASPLYGDRWNPGPRAFARD
ncbi:MAG: hypothetical protein ACRD4B_10245 [Acidobacteriota bacterium]